MKKILTTLAFPLMCVVGAHASAQNEGDIILERNKSLSNMEYQAQKLKLQAEMAESIKKMADAGFLMDESGNPIGVDNLEALGAEFRRNRGAGASEMPFPMDMGFGVEPSAFGPPPTLPTNRFVTPPQVQGRSQGQPNIAGQGQAQDPEPAMPKPRMTRLAEVRGDSVLIRTSEGDLIELRVNETFQGMKLVKIGIDSAHFMGKEGARVLNIDWAQSSASSK